MSPESYLAYPLKFRPIFKEKIWGGQNLKTEFKRSLPQRKKIGESWEIAWLGDDVSVIANGPYKGRTLKDLVQVFPNEILGNNVAERFPERFPLLFKLIDANEPISLQVHPSDEYAAQIQGEDWGKTEMWYILRAGPKAQILCGLKDWVNKENLADFLSGNRLLECLEVFPVSSGDTIYIPAGRIHGTQGSLVILEIQENSDVTYRLYDWDRKAEERPGRPLQIQNALAAIHYRDEEERIVNPIVTKKNEQVEERLLVTCDYFTTEKISIPILYQDNCDGEKFAVYFIATGKGQICPAEMPEDAMTFQKGDFLFLPASLGSFEIQTDTGCDILKTVVT